MRRCRCYSCGRSQHGALPRLHPHHCSHQAAAARLWVVLGEWALAVSNMVAEGMADDLVRSLPPGPPACFSRVFQVRVVRKIPQECKDAFEAAVAALRKLGKIDVAIEAVVKVTLLLLLMCVCVCV